MMPAMYRFTFTLLPVLAAATAPASIPPEDLALHKRAIVVDTHADTTSGIVYEGADIAKEQPDMHLDIPKMKRGGMDAQFFSIFVSPSMTKPSEYYSEALKQFDAVHAMIRRNPKDIAWATTVADIRANKKRGVISALFGVEGGHMLLPALFGQAQDPKEMIAHLDKFYELGARYMTLTWAIESPVGGSSGDASDGQGLTETGKKILDEMQRLGMMVDVSHVSDPLFWDVIRYVKRPVIASHSSARALANVPRNMTDAMLKAVAKNGGAVCVNYNPSFLDEGFAKAEQALRANVRKRGLPPLEVWRTMRKESVNLQKVPLSKLVDHIDHIAKVAGVDHVCLGSDFDGITAVPAGMEDVSKLPALTAELRKRGYTPGDVEKILGANTLRVLEANETSAGTPRRPG